MASKTLLLGSLFLTSFTLTLAAPAPAPARPGSVAPPCYEIVITPGVFPTPTSKSLVTIQTLTSLLSIITPAPELRHRQWSVNTLPTGTETDYYWDGEEPYSWPPGGGYPPWVPHSGGTVVNTGRLTVTLGKPAAAVERKGERERERDIEEKRQLSPITYAPGGWGNSVLPVATQQQGPSWWGEGKTFTFAGQTFTLGGTGVLTLTLGKPPRDVGVRTAIAGVGVLGVEGRQELSYEGGSTRGGGGSETATDAPVVTFTDAYGEVRTVTVGGSDSVAFTQTPP